VRTRHCSKGGDNIHTPRDRGRKAYTVIGPKNVIIHCFGDGDNGKSCLVQLDGIALCVIAADRNHDVELEPFDHLQYVRRAVDPRVFFKLRMVGRPEKVRQVSRLHLGRIGPRCMEKRTAGPVDRSRVSLVKPHDPFAVFLLGEIVLQKSSPPALNADHFSAVIDGAIHNSFDTGIETRDVSAAGENSNAHRFKVPFRSLLVRTSPTGANVSTFWPQCKNIGSDDCDHRFSAMSCNVLSLCTLASIRKSAYFLTRVFCEEFAPNHGRRQRRMRAISEIVRDRPLHAVNRDQTVEEAARFMAEKSIGAVPVTKENRLVGIFSERDVITRVVAMKLNPEKVVVGDVMTQRIVVAEAEESYESCLQKMRQAHCRHLPVVDRGQLIGIVSLRDLLMVDLDEKERSLEYLESYIYTIPPGMARKYSPKTQ